MNVSEAMSWRFSPEKVPFSNRRRNPDSFVLMQLDPLDILEGILLEDGHLTEKIKTAGVMREVCPECQTVHLKLVLRQKHVRQPHMFCEHCSRCFDARYADGSPALLLA